MNKQFSILIFLGCFIFCTSSCSTKHTQENTKLFQVEGHCSVVAGGADFFCVSPWMIHFPLGPNNLPDHVLTFLSSDKNKHRDKSSLDDSGVSIWVEGEGYIACQSPNDRPESAHFIFTKVTNYRSACDEYINHRKSDDSKWRYEYALPTHEFLKDKAKFLRP
jgi:hypothetical protein